jgi:uncharacterized membrane protein SpoIIM required for sporulation
MYLSLGILLLLFLFIAYHITLKNIHALSKKIDQNMYDSFSLGGKASLTNIQHMCTRQVGFEASPSTAKTVQLIKINNLIIYFSFGLVIILLVLQA